MKASNASGKPKADTQPGERERLVAHQRETAGCDTCAQVADLLEADGVELAALRKDAYRYRYLADACDDKFEVSVWTDFGMQQIFLTREQMDEAIDAAALAALATPTLADEKGGVK